MYLRVIIISSIYGETTAAAMAAAPTGSQRCQLGGFCSTDSVNVCMRVWHTAMTCDGSHTHSTSQLYTNLSAVFQE